MRKILVYSLFAAAVLFLFFFLTDKIPLWSSDEGRYGEIAREMLEMKEFSVPHFFYLPYLEKPALAPLLTALSYAVWGVTALSTRLVSILCALAGIFATFVFVKKLFSERAANFSALFLATTIGYVLVGRFAVIDMQMTFLLSTCLFCLMAAHFKQQPRYYLVSYLCMGLGFLTKGLIAMVLPGLIYLAFLIWTKNLKEIKKMRLGWGLLIIAGIILPWCIAVSIKQPGYLHTFILKHHFGRFTTGQFGRRKPFWFFAPVLLGTSFPWSLFIPAAILYGLKKENPHREKIQFLICWISVIFIFFSIPKSKLAYYLLPASPAIAVLVGAFFSDWANHEKTPLKTERLAQWTWHIAVVLCLIASAGLSVFLLVGKLKEEGLALRPVLQMSGLVIAAGALGAYFSLRKNRRTAGIFSWAAMIYAALILAFAGMLKISPFQSTFDYAEILKSEAGPADLIATISSPDKFSDLPLHLKRRVMLAGSDHGTLKNETQELQNRPDLQPWFTYPGDFIVRFNQRTVRIFAIAKEKEFPDLLSGGLKNYRVLKKSGGKILFSNR